MKITPIGPASHGNIRIKQGVDLSIAEGQHVVPLVGHEFAAAASCFPVVFLKNEENKTFQPVALTGLETGENLFIEDGQWQAHHYPLLALVYPLKLVQSPEDENRMMLGIDFASDLVSDEEGERLFDDDGKETDFLVRRRDACVRVFEQSRATQILVDRLVELDLLVPRSMNYEFGGKNSKIEGFYSVDEKKLNELPDETWLEMKSSGLLAVVYAHLVSIHQMASLIQRKARKAAKG